MTIRYLKDGVADISDDEEVVCEGAFGYYIQSGINTFKYIPHDFIVSKYYKNAEDDAPTMFDFIRDYEISDMPQIDYSLAEIFQTKH